MEGRGGGGREGEGEGGKTAHGVAMSFLRSEAFQDMAELQELLLATCFERVAMALPHRYVYVVSEVDCRSLSLPPSPFLLAPSYSAPFTFSLLPFFLFLPTFLPPPPSLYLLFPPSPLSSFQPENPQTDSPELH